MSNVVPFRSAAVCHLTVWRFEGVLEDRFVAVLVQADGKWEDRSPYFSDRDVAGEIARDLANTLGVPLDPNIHRVATWSAGGAT